MTSHQLTPNRYRWAVQVFAEWLDEQLADDMTARQPEHLVRGRVDVLLGTYRFLTGEYETLFAAGVDDLDPPPDPVAAIAAIGDRVPADVHESWVRIAAQW